MKLKGFFALLLLAGCGLMANALGQNYPPNLLQSFSLNGSTGTQRVSINGQSYCTVTVPSTATMGGGTVTLETSGDNGANYFAVTGLPDLGSGGSASTTITVAGKQLTAPVSGKTQFEVVLSGATSAAIDGTIACGNGSGALGSSSSASGGNVTIVAPTDASGNVKVNTPAPAVTGAAGTTAVALCDGTTATTCTKVTNAAGGNQSAAFAPFSQAFNYFWNGASWTAIGASSPMPVTTPAPLASLSPFPWPAHVAIKAGSGTTTYADTWPDTQATSVPITTATTTPVYLGTTSQTTYCWFIGANLTGTNSAAAYTAGYGSSGITVSIEPVTQAVTALASGMYMIYGSAPEVPSSLSTSWSPANVPFIIPAANPANNLYILSAGTTMSAKGFAYCATHAN
jgi:hypothetical protein